MIIDLYSQNYQFHKKKEKQRATYTKIIAGVVAAILVAWLGYSAVVTVQNAEGPAVKVDTTAVSDYVNGL